MSAIAAIIAFAVQHKRLLAYIGAGLAVLLALWWAYTSVWHRGYDAANAEWEARQRAAEAKAAADTAELQSALAEIDTGITIDMEAIRHVPRDKPRTIAIEVTRDLPCLHVPDRLLNATNQYTHDLATASGHRLSAVPAADATKGR